MPELVRLATFKYLSDVWLKIFFVSNSSCAFFLCDARVIENVENEVDTLRRKVQNLLIELHSRDQAIPPERPVKPLLKPRGIHILKTLKRVEGTRRLGVFLSQVENSFSDTKIRQQIVIMRVDASLAIFVQNTLMRDHMSWEELKKKISHKNSPTRARSVSLIALMT